MSSSSEYCACGVPTGSSTPSAAENRGDVVGAEREGRLEDRLPLLEPVAVHELEQLDVQLRVADLDRGVTGGREQVDLVALLDLLGLESGEAIVGVTERLAEGTPFPAGDH